jgi:translation initiation factor IF-2
LKKAKTEPDAALRRKGLKAKTKVPRKKLRKQRAEEARRTPVSAAPQATDVTAEYKAAQAAAAAPAPTPAAAPTAVTPEPRLVEGRGYTDEEKVAARHRLRAGETVRAQPPMAAEMIEVLRARKAAAGTAPAARKPGKIGKKGKKGKQELALTEEERGLTAEEADRIERLADALHDIGQKGMRRVRQQTAEAVYEEATGRDFDEDVTEVFKDQTCR